MLTDDERRVLAAIEDRCRVEDPRFAARLTRRGACWRWALRRCRAAGAGIALWCGACLAVVGASGSSLWWFAPAGVLMAVGVWLGIVPLRSTLFVRRARRRPAARTARRRLGRRSTRWAARRNALRPARIAARHRRRERPAS